MFSNVNEAVQFLLEEEKLDEGFFDTWFTGKDKDGVDSIRERLKDGFESDEAKKKALEGLDDIIDKSNREWTESDFTDYLTSVAASFTTMGILPIVRVIHRISKRDDRKSFREGVYKLRAEVAKAPVRRGR